MLNRKAGLRSHLASCAYHTPCNTSINFLLSDADVLFLHLCHALISNAGIFPKCVGQTRYCEALSRLDALHWQPNSLLPARQHANDQALSRFKLQFGAKFQVVRA
jgi:hypothetical protein